MQQRLHALDGARGFTVLFVPAIHSVMVYAHPDVHTTWLGYWLTFIAEGPGAQVFMTIMGIVFTFKIKYSAAQIIRRAILLLTAGYALNALKFVSLFYLGVLPAGVHRDLELTPGQECMQLLLMGDILHFAAVALLLLHVIYSSKRYHLVSALLATALVFIAPMLYDISPGNYLIVLFTGAPPRIFFPVLPWLIYPLIGLTIGYYLQRDAAKTFAACKTIGLSLTIIGGVYLQLDDRSSAVGFYRTYPGKTIIHVAIVLLSLWLWHWLVARIWLSDFFNVLQFCSKNITSIYLVQWILICWLLPFAGYQQMNVVESFFTACWISVIVIAGIYLVKRKNKINGY